MPILASLSSKLFTPFKAIKLGNLNAWNIFYSQNDAGLAAWNVGTAYATTLSFDIGAQETNPTGLSFKPDGTKMYVVGTTGDDVNEYNLSIPWIVSSATFIQTFSLATQELAPNDIFFKPDGTKMYIAGNDGDDILEYTLSTSWNVSTASYTQNVSVAAQETTPVALFFKDDGTKMYVLGAIGDDVNEYNLSSAWNISTATYVQNFSISAQETVPTSLFFKPDGTKMYVAGSLSNAVNEYNLSSAWNISTATYVRSFSVDAQAPSAQGLFFKPDGSTFYVLDASGDLVQQYYTGNYVVTSQETIPEGIFFKSDGMKMYVVGYANDLVLEYSLSTAWDIRTATYSQGFSVSAQNTTTRGLFFSPDGTKMYIIGTGGSSVSEYNLSSAWNVSTASYVQEFSVSAQESSPQDLFFRPDGTKMYIVGSGVDVVNEYNLSSAWNISTATFVQNFSVSAQDLSPNGLFFKPDGTNIYVVGEANDNLYEYSLSSAWNISTATYVRNFPVGTSTPAGVFFRDDGQQFFIIDSSPDRVMSFSIAS